MKFYYFHQYLTYGAETWTLKVRLDHRLHSNLLLEEETTASVRNCQDSYKNSETRTADCKIFEDMFRVFCSIVPQLAENGPKRMSVNVRCIYGSYTKSRSRNYSKCDNPTNTSRTGEEKDTSCKQYTTLARMFNCNWPKHFGTGDKVSIVGLDDTGIAIVYTLLTKGVTNNICMIDMNENILRGEHMDLQSSALFLNNPRIQSSKDPADTRDSKVCIVTTGTYKGRDERDQDYIVRSAGITRAIVTALAKHSPDAIFLVASDPVDILAFATWKLTGLPKQRIIGVGTLMDSARFQYLLSVKLGVAPESCSAYIIGEHGQNNSVPVWSNVNVAGVRLVDLNPQTGLESDPELWHEVFQDAVRTDQTVRQLKGTVSWSVGLAVAEICKAIFRNTYAVLPVSTYVKGEHSIRDEVFLSLPCVVGRAGVTNIIRQTLTDQEASLLRRGAEHILQRQEFSSNLLNC